MLTKVEYDTVIEEFERLFGNLKDKTSAWFGVKEKLVVICAKVENSTKTVVESTDPPSGKNNKWTSLNPVGLGDTKEQYDIIIWDWITPSRKLSMIERPVEKCSAQTTPRSSKYHQTEHTQHHQIVLHSLRRMSV